MHKNLLALPPEILLRIAQTLPLKPLLTFSSTCRLTRTLSTRCLHTLAFGIYPTKLARQISRIAGSTNLNEFLLRGDDKDGNGRGISDDYRAAVVLPQDDGLDVPTQLSFHDALHGAILERYAAGLRVLELSVWRMGVGVAEALALLKGLQTVSIRAENPFARRRIMRLGQGFMDEAEGVWKVLARAWPKLETLRLENFNITAQELAGILEKNHFVREIWIKRCMKARAGFFEMLGAWEGRENLEYLGLLECGPLDLDDLRSMCLLPNLQVLSLQGCLCKEPEAFKLQNTEVWDLANFQPPQSFDEPTMPGYVEVDPAFPSYAQIAFGGIGDG